MGTEYTVVSKREVSATSQHMSFHGKRHEVANTHGGQKAVTVRTAAGFTNIGFGETWEDAERNAVTAAEALAA